MGYGVCEKLRLYTSSPGFRSYLGCEALPTVKIAGGDETPVLRIVNPALRILPRRLLAAMIDYHHVVLTSTIVDCGNLARTRLNRPTGVCSGRSMLVENMPLTLESVVLQSYRQQS